jgi:hypothetical protein
MKVGRGNPRSNVPKRDRPATFGRGILGSGVRLGMSEFSMDWLNTRNWRLPSGQALTEFALQAGFLAPLLLKTEQLRPVCSVKRKEQEREPARKTEGQPAPVNNRKPDGGGELR